MEQEKGSPPLRKGGIENLIEKSAHLRNKVIVSDRQKHSRVWCPAPAATTAASPSYWRIAASLGPGDFGPPRAFDPPGVLFVASAARIQYSNYA
jgi:hypothetical protein